MAESSAQRIDSSVLCKQKREAINDLARTRKAVSVAVSGSVARGDDTDASDIDGSLP